MWIKICANTTLEDARLAADLGADAVGFVFAPSPRQVTAEQVAAIVPRLPKEVEKVGVFGTTDAEEIVRTVRETGLTGVQLHGEFDRELVRTLNAEFGGKIALIQTLHWRLDEDTDHAAELAGKLDAVQEEPAVERVLIDSSTGSASGGTGLAFDWLAARAALSGSGRLEIIAAGGLHPGNVREAIRELRPWGVDVASGVEAAKGRKDPSKMKRFIEAVRGSREES